MTKLETLERLAVLKKRKLYLQQCVFYSRNQLFQMYSTLYINGEEWTALTRGITIVRDIITSELDKEIYQLMLDVNHG